MLHVYVEPPIAVSVTDEPQITVFDVAEIVGLEADVTVMVCTALLVQVPLPVITV